MFSGVVLEVGFVTLSGVGRVFSGSVEGSLDRTMMLLEELEDPASGAFTQSSSSDGMPKPRNRAMV